jgi:hypothetical protein
MWAATRNRMVRRMSILSLVLAVSIAGWGLLTASRSQASDKFVVSEATAGQETAIAVRRDVQAGESGRQSLDILYNGTATCGSFDLEGTVHARVVRHLIFTAVHFGSCVYLGSPARFNTSSCGFLITGSGMGSLTSQGSGRCDLRVEIPGCTVHLGKGLFFKLGYHVIGTPDILEARTESVPTGGIAIGAACLSPGPSAIGQYTGYLLISASRDGVKRPLIVIL